MDETPNAEPVAVQVDRVVLRKYQDQILLLRTQLKEAEGLLTAHHEAIFCTFRGECPVCSYDHKRHYPDDIFGKIEAVLDSTIP